MMWNSFGHMGFGGGFGFGWVFTLLFWGLVIWGIVALTRSAGGHRGHNCCGQHGEYKQGEKTPMDFLKERYAKGEINKEEFDSKKKDLE